MLSPATSAAINLQCVGGSMSAEANLSSGDGVRGVATLLLAMDKEDAARLLGRFDEDEIGRIASTTAELGAIARQRLGEIIDIFELDLKQEPGLVGSELEAERLIEAAVSEEAAGRIMASVRGDIPPVEFWGRLPALPPDRISATLSKEHPQVVAFALSRLDPEQAALVIAQFDHATRQRIFDDMIDIGTVTDRAVQLLEFHLAKQLLATTDDDENSGMHAKMAGIMNRLDRDEVDELLVHFDAIRPKAAKALRGLIFSFDDVANLSQAHCKILFEAVPSERIILALRGAPEVLVNAALDSLTGRSRRMVEMELQSSSPLPEKDVEEAQRWIADLAIDLAQDGKIELSPDGSVEAIDSDSRGGEAQ